MIKYNEVKALKQHIKKVGKTGKASVDVSFE